MLQKLKECVFVSISKISVQLFRPTLCNSIGPSSLTEEFKTDIDAVFVHNTKC